MKVALYIDLNIALPYQFSERGGQGSGGAVSVKLSMSIRICSSLDGLQGGGTTE